MTVLTRNHATLALEVKAHIEADTYAAADAAARIRQRDTLLRLISEATMGIE